MDGSYSSCLHVSTLILKGHIPFCHGTCLTDYSYAFDVIYRHGEPFLANRRLFAYADSGIPDGIKCDTAGNVYSGCPDGINVWSPGGVLLGKIVISVLKSLTPLGISLLSLYVC